MSTPLEILVVEDEPETARVMLRVFRAAGYKPTLAFSCAAARNAAGPFKIAVLDIDLGDGDGVSLAIELLAESRVARVMFHTATRDEARQAQARAIGQVVSKSGDPQPLLRALEAAVAMTG